MLDRLLGSRSYASLGGGQNVGKEQQRRAPVSLILATGVCVVLAFFELFVVFFQISIADADKFSNDARTVYTAGIAIIATLIAFFVTSQIRNATVRWLDYRLATESRAAHRSIDTAWRANLGFLGPKERLLTVSSWPTQLLYVVTGLLAAGFIAALTPTDAVATTSYGSWIPTGADNSCAGTVPKKPTADQPSGWSAGEATWSVSDASNFAATNRSDSSRCALSQMPGLLSSVNNEAPDKMAYSSGGVAVQGSAVGAPEILFSTLYNPNVTSAFRNIFSDKGASLDSVTQCAPVLKKNPFSCQPDSKGGDTQVIQVGQSNFGTFETSTGGCSFSKWYNGDLENGTLAQLMQGTFCAGANVGQGTLVLGGYANAAVNLALMVGDYAWAEANWQSAQGYTVRCDVDVAAAIGWRQVTLSLQQRPTPDAPYAQTVTGGDDCAGQDLGPSYAATAAGVAGKVVNDENEDIYFPKTLIAKALNATGNHPAMYKAAPIAPSPGMVRNAPWALDGSRNGLEDTLGVAAGLVMSKAIAQNFTGNEDVGTVVTLENDSNNQQRVKTYTSASSDSILPMLNLTGSAGTAVVRVGLGRPAAAVFALPALLSGLIALFFVLRTPWHGEARRASSLLDIMAMGAAGQGLGDLMMHQQQQQQQQQEGSMRDLQQQQQQEFQERNRAAVFGADDGEIGGDGSTAKLMNVSTAYKADSIGLRQRGADHDQHQHQNSDDDDYDVLEKPRMTASQ